MLNNKQKEIYKNLGISPDYGDRNNLKFYKDAIDLIDVGPNVVGVNQRLSKKTALQWGELLKAAAEDNISIIIVSGYRSFNYQANLIQKKLEKGIDIKDILKVNAPPGYSQHHSGRGDEGGRLRMAVPATVHSPSPLPSPSPSSSPSP
mgnify:CR=1 FL=1